MTASRERPQRPGSGSVGQPLPIEAMLTGIGSKTTGRERTVLKQKREGKKTVLRKDTAYFEISAYWDYIFFFFTPNDESIFRKQRHTDMVRRQLHFTFPGADNEYWPHVTVGGLGG